MIDIAGAIQDQVREKVDAAVDEKIQEIIQTVQARWEDRVNRRIAEAQWAVEQGKIYKPDHALLKMYEAYRWVADHVHLGVEIARNGSGASISMTAQSDDDTTIDSFRQERISECIEDLTKLLNYSYF